VIKAIGNVVSCISTVLQNILYNKNLSEMPGYFWGSTSGIAMHITLLSLYTPQNTHTHKQIVR